MDADRVDYDIVPASVRHIRRMVKGMRDAARASQIGLGVEPRRALHHAISNSGYARTALVDGEPKAIWGVTSPLLGEVGFVWLVLADDLPVSSRRLMAIVRFELDEIAEDYQELMTTVLPTDRSALHFALHLGFHDRHEDGPRGRGRSSVERILADPQYRVPLGTSYVIALGYHVEAVT